MRVYGSSPLYNYVELVFRSKRLFIVSIVLATVLTASLAMMRAGTYTATALVLLSGSTTGPQMDADARGTVKYKLNVLNVVSKDPQFMQDALREAGLNRGLTDDQFNQFSKDARGALNFSAGENVLEISCRWKDARAEDIIKAFYAAYSRRVFDQETVVSTNETKLLTAMLDEYTQKESALDKRIRDYREKNMFNLHIGAEEASSLYQQQKSALDNAVEQRSIYLDRLAKVKSLLANTQQKQIDVVETGGFAQNPRYQSLLNEQEKWQTALQALQAKYTDTHPDVVRAKTGLALVNKELAKMEAQNGVNSKQKGPKIRERETINPQWQMLDNRRQEMEIYLSSMDTQIAKAQDQLEKLRRRAQTAPTDEYNYKLMTRNKDLYSSIRANLTAKVESAKMEEQRDRALHLAEMTMAVQPKAEPDMVGSKNLMYYAAGPLIGLIIAFAFSLLFESLDHSLRTPLEVEKHLGKPVLAVIPRLDTPKEASRRRLGGGGGGTQPTLPSS